MASPQVWCSGAAAMAQDRFGHGYGHFEHPRRGIHLQQRWRHRAGERDRFKRTGEGFCRSCPIRSLRDQEIGTVTAPSHGLPANRCRAMDGAHDTRRCHTAIIDRPATAIIPVRKNGRPWTGRLPGSTGLNQGPARHPALWQGVPESAGTDTAPEAGSKRTCPHRFA